VSGRPGSQESAIPTYEFTVNGRRRSVAATPEMPLLWVLRDLLALTGTKYGCGVGACGACTVREGRDLLRSCQLSVADAAGRAFVTIEGLAEEGGAAVQQAWIEADVSHCGYCQPAMLLAAAVLVDAGGPVDDATIDTALDGHLCRCGSYPRIRQAVKRAAEIRRGGP
jgi:isoquinoline 1-oxidoreductase alpha subunit